MGLYRGSDVTLGTSSGDKGSPLCSRPQGPWDGEPPTAVPACHGLQAPLLGDPLSPEGGWVLRTSSSRCVFLFPVKVCICILILNFNFFFKILFSFLLHFFWIDLLSFSFIVFPSTNLKAIYNTTILSAFTLKFNIHIFNLPSKHCRKFLITLSPITLCPTCYSSFVF